MIMKHTTMAAATSSNRAIKRLQQDLRDLQTSPIPNVVAVPLESNILEWRVNMVAAEGRLQGVPMHMHITFPSNYPEAPPEVILITIISHPFVIGNKICVDMLNFSGYHGEVTTEPYSGWSAAYTMSSILMQLYGLLLVDERVSYGDVSIRNKTSQETGIAARCLNTLKACRCGFHTLPKRHSESAAPSCRQPQTNRDTQITLANYVKPARRKAAAAPPRDAQTAVGALPLGGDMDGTATVTITASPRPQEVKGPEGMITAVAGAEISPIKGDAGTVESLPALAGLDQLDDNIARLLLSKMPAQDLLRCCGAGSARLARLARDVLQRSELLCFFSRRPHDEVVLGFGVQVQRRSGRAGGGRNQQRPAAACAAADIQSLSTQTDFLSLEAFESGVRHSAWNMAFDAFLPLYLNPQHGKRSLAVLPRCIGQILTPAGHAGNPTPAQLLAVMGLLMNSLVVEVVAGSSGNTVSRHMSDAALQGFCHLHHLLLAVALEPGSHLLQTAEAAVVSFMEDESSRRKSCCPDLGRLLVSYLLVPEERAPWSEFAPVLLRELMARQVRWVMNKAGPGFGQPQTERHTADADTRPEFDRLKSHFEGSVVGIRNVMLQAWFANALARPRTAAGAHSQLLVIKGAYDELSGCPAPRVFAAFNRHAREVMRCGSWVDMLAGLRLGLSAAGGVKPRALFVAIISQAVLDSYDAKYHASPNPYERSKDLVAKHYGRRQAEARAELQANQMIEAGGVDKGLEAADEGGWKEVTAKPAKPAYGHLPCSKVHPLLAMVREKPRVCFVSWEMRPVGVVVGSKWV